MLAMNSDLSQSANNDSGTAYRRNQVKSCCFLGILFLSLLIALVLSLRAGSYNTPIAELVKGVFGKAADDKINLVVRNNRLPRICTALIAGARQFSAIRLHLRPRWVFHRALALARRLQLSC